MKKGKITPNKVVQVDNHTIGLVLEPSEKICLIDSKNYDLVKNYRWVLYTQKCKYSTQYYIKSHVYLNNKRTTIRISRLILNPPINSDINYVDHNGLNNKELNLKIVSRQQNDYNKKSKYTSSRYSALSIYRQTPNKIVEVDKNTIGLILEPSGKICLIDKETYPLVKDYRWGLYSKKYKHSTQCRVDTDIHINNKRIVILLHRLILSPPKHLHVDHIDGNPLNNKKSNLRIANAHQNSANSRSNHGTSQYKGVCWNKRNNNWTAQIHIFRKKINLGSFKNEVDAAQAYNAAAIKYFGEYACLNKIL
jgi:hypothetical protein